MNRLERRFFNFSSDPRRRWPRSDFLLFKAYEKTVRPIMYKCIKDKKYFQRNAAIALGNTGLAEHIPVLSQAMNSSEEIVRGYAAWGLGRIGGNGARSALERCVKNENSHFVISEIRTALET